MKTKFLFTTLMLITFLGFSQQLKFFTNKGAKEITKGNCSLSDLSVRVPIPANAINYDKLRFFVFLTPKRESNSQAIYECFLEKEFFSGKKEVEIALKTTDGINDFYGGRYGMNWGGSFGNNSALNIDKPCANPERVDQVYTISFELEGMKFLKNDYLSEGNLGKQPIYQLAILKKWHNAFPMDYGVVDFNSISKDQSFSISKIYDVPVEIRHDEDETVVSVSSAIIGTLKSIPNSQSSIDEVKNDIIKSIKTRTLYNSEDPKYRWSIDLCYPCYAKKIKKSDNSDLDAQLKDICTTPADWKPSKISGIDGFILDIPKTLDYENWNQEGSKARVSQGDEIPWRKFMAFVVENKGKIFIGIIEYRRGNQANTDIVAKFFTDVLTSFKVR